VRVDWKQNYKQHAKIQLIPMIQKKLKKQNDNMEEEAGGEGAI
jgi:hypothetical protein